MTQIRYTLSVVFALLLTASASHAQDCRNQTTGDICGTGSSWRDLTRFRLRVHSEGHDSTTTLTMHGRDDFSIDIDDTPMTHGTIVVIGGRAMLMKDVAHDTGYEIDALDGPVLLHQLVMTLLDQAFPQGPPSVAADSVPIKIVQKTRSIRIATQSAEGHLGAPWTLTGTARRTRDRIDYDLQFVFTVDGSSKSMVCTGFWEKALAAPPLDDNMSLDGWSLHWLAPITSTSDQGTILQYGAKPVSEHWPNLGALRKYIDDEPARRALRRVPADAANPGPIQTLSYEAFSVDKQGLRKRLGDGVRQYRPGTDILVEQMEAESWRKILTLDYGLSVSATVYPKEKLTGFGLVLSKDDGGFSWEWFNRAEGDVFHKLLGGGKVKASVLSRAGSEELVAVEFLDDIVLTCEDDGVTHELRVKKSSVLRLKP